MSLRSIWNNPYLVRERQSARVRRLLVLTVVGVYVLAAIVGLATVLAAHGAQSPSQAFWVRVSPDHWLRQVTTHQAFGRGLVGGANFAIWIMATAIAPIWAAVRRSGEMISGQADLVTITRLSPRDVAIGSVLSSLLWIWLALGAVVPLLAAGHVIVRQPAWTLESALGSATLIVGSLARGSIGFVGAQKYGRKGAAIIFTAAFAWVLVPVAVFFVQVLAAVSVVRATAWPLMLSSQPQLQHLVSVVTGLLGLAMTLLIAPLCLLWAVRSCEQRKEPPLVAEMQTSRFDLEPGPSLWKMGKTDFERIVFEPKARKAADLPPDEEEEEGQP